LVQGQFYFYGSACTTNNHAEMQALVHCLEFIYGFPVPENISTIVVQGDSSLVIQYMLGSAKANAAHLVQLYAAAKRLTH
jgi:ribonuclease HI